MYKIIKEGYFYVRHDILYIKEYVIESSSPIGQMDLITHVLYQLESNDVCQFLYDPHGSVIPQRYPHHTDISYCEFRGLTENG